jgi:predicted nucleotidyltransferase
MNFETVSKGNQQILLKSISGSRAYNLSLPYSDTDIKGIFVLPQSELYGLTYTEQVSNPSHDEVFFEIGRFMELLSKNNPNILELLSSPMTSILYRHPLMDLIKAEDYLSKLCLHTFAGYAKTQMKKAKGLNKKINQSFEREKKTILEFCYVVKGIKTISLNQWLNENGIIQQDCGIMRLDHFRDAYGLFHQSQIKDGDQLNGLMSGMSANDVQLSVIPKSIEPLAIMHFNKDGYSTYCKEYGEYWNWVDERNEARYENNIDHGKNYDTKNMMHTFRLLNMAEEIAVHKEVIVHRPDRDFLLQIRNGEFEYDELLAMVEKKMIAIESAYDNSDLPDEPDLKKTENILVKIRESFYSYDF